MLRITTTTLSSILLLLQFVLAGTANAALVDKTEAGLPGGDFNLTLDESTGFYWLDLDVYAGESRDTVKAIIDAGTVLPGFVIADRDDVKDLFGSMLISTANWPSLSVSSDSGVAYFAGSSHIGTGADPNVMSGFTDTSSGVGTYRLATLAFGLVGTQTHTTGNYGGAVGANSYVNVGTWLYRDGSGAVPEPSTFTMLAFCGLAMAGYSRLRRRRK